MAITLPPALDYFPLQNGPFEFRTGLRALRPDPAHPGERLLQFDELWPRYREEKLAARRERLDKYLCQYNLTPAIATETARFLIDRLCQEWPSSFEFENEGAGSRLHCRLSGETLHFDAALALTGTDNPPDPPYGSALDALCSQMQEDLAVTTLDDSGGDTITLLHLCLPNYWAAEEKIGQSFLNAHMPVPGMERINRQSGALLAMLMERGPFERFTWGLTSDPRLNHHPQPAPGISHEAWFGRRFDAAEPRLWLRIERQVTAALPPVRSFLFTIRTYLRDVTALNGVELERLIQAIETMPEEVRRYKGLAAQQREMVTWLERLRRERDRPS